MKKVFLTALAVALTAHLCFAQTSDLSLYQQRATHELLQLVQDASQLIKTKGESAFLDFRVEGSPWRRGDTYIFVLDPQGNMLVHTDTLLEGKNQLHLRDVNGKLIVRGLLDAAGNSKAKTNGWYHYQWPVPGGIQPRWKSTYVIQVTAPNGKQYVVGCGIYNDAMERGFVVDLVQDAAAQISKNQEEAFQLFHDPKSRFSMKEAYIFVFDSNGKDLVNPGFPNLEGRNLMDLKDSRGKLLVKEMYQVIQQKGSGWVDYMWPKPGETISTLKSSYVSKAKVGDSWVLVGCGVYLADAPKASPLYKRLDAPELMTLVREAAKEFEKKGEEAFPEFRMKGSKWFKNDTYFFVWTLDGIRTFHAADPASEGIFVGALKDVHGRPFGKMFLETANTPRGEGWVHYMYPEPGDIFPTWKSSFVKKVKFPSGKSYLIGCGIYNMQMDRAFIEDLVNNAADKVAAEGEKSFVSLRDKTGPFNFMGVYVFVDSPDGIEWVNAAQPNLEGRNLIHLKDAAGKEVVKNYLDLVMKNGSAWVEYEWFKPGENTPATKHTYVKKVSIDGKTYILGAGYYP